MSASQSIAANTEQRAISDFAQVNPPQEIPKDLSATSLVSFVPMADVSESGEWLNRQSRAFSEVRSGFTCFRDNDVLVAKITPCLENGKGAHVTELVNGIGFGSTEFHVLRADESTCARFLFHVTQSRRFRSAAESYMIGSAGQKRVQAEFFAKYKIQALSSAEQRQIAAVLDILDTAIRQTEAIIEKLKQVKQGLLHDLLTRGIDENGELRPPQSEAPHLYKRSPLGWIPRAWTDSNVATGFTIDSGITLGPERQPRRNIRPYLRVANVQRSQLDLDDVAFLEIRPSELPGKLLNLDDLLVVEGHASTAEIGRCAIATEEVRGYTFQNHLFRLSARNVDAYFGLLWMNSEYARGYWAREAATSSGLNTINRTKLARLCIPVATRQEQTAIVRAANAYEHRIEVEAATRRCALEVRAGLSDDLLTGRVRVRPLLAE